jgi:hypothetical protein
MSYNERQPLLSKETHKSKTHLKLSQKRILFRSSLLLPSSRPHWTKHTRFERIFYTSKELVVIP